MEVAGWGRDKNVKFDYKTGQRYVMRSEVFEDYKFLKRYIKFLSDDFRRQDLELLESSFKLESFEKN